MAILKSFICLNFFLNRNGFFYHIPYCLPFWSLLCREHLNFALIGFVFWPLIYNICCTRLKNIIGFGSSHNNISIFRTPSGFFINPLLFWESFFNPGRFIPFHILINRFVCRLNSVLKIYLPPFFDYPPNTKPIRITIAFMIPVMPFPFHTVIRTYFFRPNEITSTRIF